MNATTITPVGGADIFVAKFSSNDSLHWFKNYGSFNNDNAGSIISDENGSIYFTSQTAQKAILNKLTSAGDSIWNRIVGNPNNNNFFATDLIYKNHKIIVTGGYFNNNILIGNIAFPFTSHTNLYLAQVDSNGIYDWGIVGECTGSISPFSMRFSNDNIYINGNFGGLTGPYLYQLRMTLSSQIMLLKQRDS